MYLHSMRLCKSFNTQPPEGGWIAGAVAEAVTKVSTHSRLKAAGNGAFVGPFGRKCFNTQPPEGGWQEMFSDIIHMQVSTHSRLKAAGALLPRFAQHHWSFNTQPPEGGWMPIRPRSLSKA